MVAKLIVSNSAYEREARAIRHELYRQGIFDWEDLHLGTGYNLPLREVRVLLDTCFDVGGGETFKAYGYLSRSKRKFTLPLYKDRTIDISYVKRWKYAPNSVDESTALCA